MNLLFALCGFCFGFIVGVALYALTEYEKNDDEKEN